ncbi:helix-turn-helix domain-containing protein [Enterobacteriaceae bacterium G50]|nr:helix-turn-helix domain-containing protein [Enterobacteriaceae bacterium G50]
MQLQKIEMTTETQWLNLPLMVEKDNQQQDFARRLSAEMSRQNLAVKDLSQACGVTYEMARRYTLGTAKPRPEKLERIAHWLKVEPSWLEYGIQRDEEPVESRESPPTPPDALGGRSIDIDDFSVLSEDERRLLRIFRQYPYIESQNMLNAFEYRFKQLKDFYSKK